MKEKPFRTQSTFRAHFRSGFGSYFRSHLHFYPHSYLLQLPILTAIILSLAACILPLTACSSIHGSDVEGNVADGSNTNDNSKNTAENSAAENDDAFSSSTNTLSENCVYQPQFFTLEGTYIDYGGVQPSGETLCYLSIEPNEATGYYEQYINLYSLTDGSIISAPLTWPEEPENIHLSRYAFGPDASLYALAISYSQDLPGSRDYLCRFDSQGNCLSARDITEELRENPENQTYISAILLDQKEQIYLQGNETVWLYDREGTFQGTLSPASSQNAGNFWINSLLSSAKGKMYISYTIQGSPTRSYTLAELDFEAKSLTAISTDFPGDNDFACFPAGLTDASVSAGLINSGASADSTGQTSSDTLNSSSGETDWLLMQDRANLYAYDPASRTEEMLLNWLECNINGNDILNFWEGKNESIIAVLSNNENNGGEIALLTKVNAEEAIQKEEIILAVLRDGYNYQPSVVEFNRNNDQYHVTIKEYMNTENGSSVSRTDALAKLYADISSGNCPDIIELTGLDVEQLAQKKAFEDLNPYLADSALLNAEDFVEEILTAYTFDNNLVCVPSLFFLETIMGSSSQLGTDSGWTLDELIALAEAHPEAELFDSVERKDILDFILLYCDDMFVDWATGECKFDSESFHNLLQFVNGFPEEANRNPDQPTTPIRIQNGEALLKNIWLYDFDSIQMEIEIFQKNAVCIGFPTADGAAKHVLTAAFAYAIPSNAKHKEGAWTFIESYLAKESAKDNNQNQMGFPTVKRRLEAMIKEATKVAYILDENGEPYLDENGEPVISGSHTTSSSDGWSYTYHTATQEEVDMILALLDGAVLAGGGSSNEIRNIVIEETEGYFRGQKTVEDVSKIIQNRVKLYVDENR